MSARIFRMTTTEFLQRLSRSGDDVKVDDMDSWLEQKVDSSLAHVLTSFEEHGFIKAGALQVDTRGDEWTLVNGHHRVLAVILLGLPHVWIRPIESTLLWSEPARVVAVPKWDSVESDAATAYANEIRHAFVYSAD